MTKNNIKPDTFEHRMFIAIDEINAVGHMRKDKFLIVVHDDFPHQIKVLHEDQGLVAYSEMKGDYEPSLREFVEDYLL